MSLRHHPSDSVLTRYAAGGLGKGPALVVEAHLGACAACRREVAQWEAVGGALLDRLPPAAMAPDALARALARIETTPPPPGPRVMLPTGIDLSAALEALPLGRRRWLGPGVWVQPVLDQPGGGKTYLLRTGPGQKLLQHGHTGEEFVCVLHGGFSDDAGRYGPGDFAQADPGRDHAPVADLDGECVCLISTDGPLRMRGLIGRLIQFMVGL